MLQKWKLILANWINCYYDEDGNNLNPVTQESLLKIISHLRENFNLNESNSAIVDAYTIQEFVLEKFPGFRFENGTVEPINEEEIYLAASLLLFFVCVNSKDVDIKKAMCFNLIADDQVIIFKFTKYLLDCRNITCRDLVTAIAEACEPDMVVPSTVAETPPALRSLHSELRRIQAALDAERFDRNYLQEELARTNLKMEKLVKDKDQYKQEIAELKSKVLCCGQESESKNAESSNNNLPNLLKQLEDTEDRLGTVQEQLDEVTYERNTYKSKVDELKHERDKWFTLSQQESLRSNQLTEELETERKQVTSLRELVSELRQHHRLNGLDCSQLECDDLDASVHSLQHNMSVCNEVCANVVEVQLGEERAKILVLKEQIQMLQDQLTEVNRKAEEESKNLEQIITEKDNDIFNLKHRINEEIEEKNNLKSHCDNEMTKLNNEVNELEQRLRDTNENSRRIIESKIYEIQILQEEKLSLLKSLNDETTKLNNIIQELKASLESERSSKLKMREYMDNQIMKLKEKVLNRNNELVEFQNKIFEKVSERDSLLNEKAILVQQLMEERSVRKIADEGKEALLTEAREMNRHLELLKEMLIQEKECLTQQLVEERHSKELAEQEKKNINEAKLALEARIASDELLKNKQIQSLSKNIDEQRLINDKLHCNIKQLNQEIEALINDNANQKKEIDNHINIAEQIRTQNETLTNERNSVVNSLKDIETQLHEMESEKKSLQATILETNNKYASEIEEKQQEIKSVSMEYRQLKTEHKTLGEEIERLSSLLNSGLTKVIDCFKKEDICKEIMQKYEIVEKDLSGTEICDVLFYIITNLTADVVLRKKLEKALEQENTAVKEVTEMVKQKEIVLNKQQEEIKALEKVIDDTKYEFTKQQEKYETLLDTKTTDYHNLLLDNQSLRNELNDVKIQLEVKVHSLKDKLIDNENLTDKLKKTYECQIDNLNMMISKISTYLKEKTAELEALRNEKERLQNVVEENNTVIKSLEDELKSQKQNQEKLISDFESERLVFKNMVTVTESVMEDQKISLNKVISEQIKSNDTLENEIRTLKQSLEDQKLEYDNKIKEKEIALQTIFKELCDLRKEKESLDNKIISQNELYKSEVANLEKRVADKSHEIEMLQKEYKELDITFNKYKDDVMILEEKNNEWKIKNDLIETEFGDKVRKLKNDFDVQRKCTEELKILLDNKSKENSDLYQVVEELSSNIENLKAEIAEMENSKSELLKQLSEQKNTLNNQVKQNETLQNDYSLLLKVKDEKESEVSNLQKLLQSELNKNEENGKENINLNNKCSILQEYQTKAETELDRRQKDINTLQVEVKTLETRIQNVLSDRERDNTNLKEERDAKRELEKKITEEKDTLKYQLDLKETEITSLKKKLDERKEERDIIRILRIENEKLITAIGQRETFAVASQEEPPQYSGHSGGRDLKQVDNTSDTQSSLESIKTISDLEKILQDKNRTIKTLQSDITFLKSLFAESENKVLDVSKDLELSKENCHQLSSQLKKIVHQKNEEIADLKKQVTKMSLTENKATQIIKVSAKYQAIILKRIAEIKSNTVLKELTNFGNSNCDSDLRRSLTSGSITMEDLENFLETTERHLRRCSEKQKALQMERDRLTEVNKINESEIINMQKFLTEMSVGIKTFNSYKEMYSQKLTRVVSIQRTVRREILNLESNITDAAMCKLERGYAAVMQDLSECAMNFERWVERCISRTISSEKIKQAFSSEVDRMSLASGSFQNAGLEVQLEELENKFQNLLDEVARAQKGEGAKDVQSLTVMEVRAEYEDKLNRMKSKMKQLYQEQISIFKEKQRQEIINLEQELQKAQHDLRESSRAYKEHIKELTSELWQVGEKFVMKHDEAEWLRKKQKHGSLMSLQHVHSSGLVPIQEPSRPSDTHSLRSLPVNNNEKTKEGRQLHMSDEEGEVFDNRWLRELSSTPRSHPRSDVHPHPHPPHPPHRLSELRWRNSLCPPHLKSSYPAETQFVSALHEEDIKCQGGPSLSLGGRQRKEVGITAYKKPGPPTPSKQAGRLSATDSELRECVREASARRGGTPSRIRALFRTGRTDNTEGTPKTRRLSNIFRKK